MACGLTSFPRASSSSPPKTSRTCNTAKSAGWRSMPWMIISIGGMPSFRFTWWSCLARLNLQVQHCLIGMTWNWYVLKAVLESGMVKWWSTLRNRSSTPMVTWWLVLRKLWQVRIKAARGMESTKQVIRPSVAMNTLRTLLYKNSCLRPPLSTNPLEIQCAEGRRTLLLRGSIRIQ